MRDFFRAMGILLLVVAAGFVVGSIITVFRYVLPAHEFRGIIGLGGIALFLIAVGVGLLKLKKWAALAFSILCLIWGFLGIRQAIEGSIHPVPGSADWLGFVFTSLLSVPPIVTFKCWKDWNRVIILKSKASK